MAARPRHVDTGQLCHRRDFGDEARLGTARLARVEAVDVGEQHERVGLHEVGDQRGEAIVVAEADLVGGDGVVLVHDRNDAEREQPLEGAVGVAVMAAAVQVVSREQHLADPEPVPREGHRVPLGEQQLADAGSRLLGRQVARAGLEPQRPDAGSDGARRDDARPAARLLPGRERVDEAVQPGRVELAARGERRRADLDDRPRSRGYPVARALVASVVTRHASFVMTAAGLLGREPLVGARADIGFEAGVVATPGRQVLGFLDAAAAARSRR